MVERLRKCMTTNEKYFCELVLCSNRVLTIKVDTLAKELRLSPSTIRNALGKLEIAGYVTTEKSYNGTVVKIRKQKLIRQVVSE